MSVIQLPLQHFSERPNPRPFNAPVRSFELATLMEGLRALMAEATLPVLPKGGDDPTEHFAKFARDFYNWYLKLNLVDADTRPAISETLFHMRVFMGCLAMHRTSEVCWIRKIQYLPRVPGIPSVDTDVVHMLLGNRFEQPKLQELFKQAGYSKTPEWELTVGGPRQKLSLEFTFQDGGLPFKRTIHAEAWGPEEAIVSLGDHARALVAQAESLVEQVPGLLASPADTEESRVKGVCHSLFSELSPLALAAMQRHPEVIQAVLAATVSPERKVASGAGQ